MMLRGNDGAVTTHSITATPYASCSRSFFEENTTRGRPLRGVRQIKKGAADAAPFR